MSAPYSRSRFEAYNGGSTRIPQLPYDFINEITNNYEVLKANYEHHSKLLLNENPAWRDDFRFLYLLCEAFKLNKETCKWPKNSMEKSSSSLQRQVELSWFICSNGLLFHIKFYKSIGKHLPIHLERLVEVLVP